MVVQEAGRNPFSFWKQLCLVPRALLVWVMLWVFFQVVLVVKSPPANAGDGRDPGSIPGLGRSPGGGHGNPLQYPCLENPRGRRSLAGYRPWSYKELDMAEWLNNNGVCVLSRCRVSPLVVQGDEMSIDLGFVASKLNLPSLHKAAREEFESPMLSFPQNQFAPACSFPSKLWNTRSPCNTFIHCSLQFNIWDTAS